MQRNAGQSPCRTRVFFSRRSCLLRSGTVYFGRIQPRKRRLVLTRDGSSAERLHRAIKYRPDIDGLRAIAITSVVAYHAGLRWTKGGFVGVDIFFVISGYLIGSLVYKEIRGRSFRISKFYGRRAQRILPALFGVLMFSYVAAILLLSPLEMKDFARGALATIAS